MRKPVILIQFPETTAPVKINEIALGFSKSAVAKDYHLMVVISGVKHAKVSMLGLNRVVFAFLFWKIKKIIHGIIGSPAEKPAEVRDGQKGGAIPG